VEDIVSSVDWWAQGLCEELNTKFEETQLSLQMSLDTWTKDLLKELDAEILESVSNMQTARP
jgi:hypothetical protein